MPPVSETEVNVKDGAAEGGLSQADCICPVCLEIFLEPVTLPCSHTFCKPCFLETVDKANICCPLCRRRVSTWARLHGRNKTLVNVELWRRLQEAFPVQCQRRLTGQDVEDTATVPRPKVSQPGELRREYEDQISKLAEEKRALEEAERRASEEYIQRLLAEEEERLAEERRVVEERQLEEDERLARMLSDELNSNPVSESQIKSPVDSASTKKKKSTAGDIERFLFPVPMRSPSSTETSPSSSLTANKENILMPSSSREMGVDLEPPMPMIDFYGDELSPRPHLNETEPCPLNGSCTGAKQDLDGWTPSSNQAGGGAGSKRKSGDMDPGIGDGLVSKRPCTPSNTPVDTQAGTPLFRELVQEEEDRLSRWQQEESDRQLALRLQRQLDREEAQRAVDRRKGSPDQYELREKPCSTPSPAPTATSDRSTAGRVSRDRSSAALSLKEEKSTVRRQSSRTPKEKQAPHRSSGGSTPKRSGTTRSSHLSGTSTLPKGSKQTTLTDMFSSLAR
ncbi:E3 ubiquitin-protein ligase rnf168 isoform X2 [Megalops cyprinoides]|uniref:E3 ubiquitin-protein ligase rnf168 isoform X2 n=1 Tax=Megalops cyprinoides TaxID=118141 RepID=UPI001864B8A5|nr:E3 ubiquitin-protein ligase rnf168 isoform X2 [Megalops cyprinoides]